MKITLNKDSRRKLVVTAMLSAVALILMLLDFSVPIMPGFIKMDFSELPALIAAYAFGPWWGALVCLVKNVLHLTMTTTACVGEAANFMLGVCFVVPAGYIYKIKKCKLFALLGALAGAVIMALISFPINFYFTYPFYSWTIPMDQIITAYRKIMPSINTIGKALFIFNVPFNFVKGLITALIAFVIYKPLSPIIKGKIK